jgi:proteasome lid subunit RPN8/RPN11
MVDDIQLLVLGDEEDVQNDEAEVQAQSTKRKSRGLVLPHIGTRVVRTLMILTAVLLIGAGVYGVSTWENASLLWLISGFPFFGGGSGDDNEPDSAEHAHSDGGLSLSEVEDTEAHETGADIPAESSAATRARPEMSVTNADREREVDTLVKTLMRQGEQLPLPDASGIVAPIRRPLAATLEGIPQELTVLRRDVGPVLVGITYNEKTVDRLSSVYDTMLVVAPHHEDALPEVLKYLPALIQTNGVSGLGSARTFTIPAPEPPGPEAESQATLKDLRGHKGEPLHPLARTEPDFLTVSAPSEWTGPARSVLSDYAPVIDIIEWDADKIHVAGFVFDSAIDLPDHIVDTNSAADESEGSVETGNENPPNSGTGDSGSNADYRPEADGGATQYSSVSGADTGTGTPSSGAGEGTAAPSDTDEGDTTRSPPDSDSTIDSGSESPAGTGSQPVAGGTVDAEDDDDGIPTGPATAPGDASGRPDESPGEAPSTAGGGDPDTPTQDGDVPSESDDSPSTGQSGSEKRNMSADSNGGGPADEDGSDDDSEGAETHSQLPSDEAPATDDEVPESDNRPSETSPPSEDGGTGDGSSGEGGALPPADANIDFGTDTGRGQTPADGSSKQSSTGGDGGSKSGQEAGGDSGAALQPPSDSSDSTGGPSKSGDTDAGDGPVTSSSAATSGPTPGTPDDKGSAPSAAPEPSYDTDDGYGIVPFGEAPASSDPMVVDVAEHVLNELVYQATATPDREVYSTVYADEDGLIRHQHMIDHPDFLESREKSISFTPAFYEHLRLLASQRKDIGHRLAGGVHSHPVSGRPYQSSADKRFTQKIWQTQRNTAFVVGVNEGSGPDEWTITDDGYEVQRQSNEYLIRIRAFSGETKLKQIRLHQDMGQ